MAHLWEVVNTHSENKQRILGKDMHIYAYLDDEKQMDYFTLDVDLPIKPVVTPRPIKEDHSIEPPTDSKGEIAYHDALTDQWYTMDPNVFGKVVDMGPAFLLQKKLEKNHSKIDAIKMLSEGQSLPLRSDAFNNVFYHTLCDRLYEQPKDSATNNIDPIALDSDIYKMTFQIRLPGIDEPVYQEWSIPFRLFTLKTNTGGVRAISRYIPITREWYTY